MDRIIVADDHPLFRSALISALSRAAPGRQVMEASSLAEVRETLSAGPPVELLLLDLKLADSEGFGGLVEIRGDHPAVAVVVISASEEAATIRKALDFGAAGFIPKSATLDQMAEAISAILDGDVWAPALPEPNEGQSADEGLEARIASLTPSQFRILVGLQQGRLNKQIAYDLGVTEATIKAHLTVVFRKLGVHNRTQAVIAAQALNLEA